MRSRIATFAPAMLTVLANTTLSLFILAELLSQRKINANYLSGDREKLVILTASFIPHLYSMGVLFSPITLRNCRHLCAFVPVVTILIIVNLGFSCILALSYDDLSERHFWEMLSLVILGWLYSTLICLTLLYLCFCDEEIDAEVSPAPARNGPTSDLKDIMRKAGSEVNPANVSTSAEEISDSCVICFEKYDDKMVPYKLAACAHTFHRACLQKFW